MPTYQFSCECGRGQELTCSWSRRPASLPCSCGKQAEPHITGGRAAFVKGREMVYDHKHTIPNMGWHVGRSDAEQHRIYSKIVGDAKRDDAQRRRNLAKKEDFHCERVGKMPLEIAEYIREAHGPDALMQDPEGWLKKTDCWTGE